MRAHSIVDDYEEAAEKLRLSFCCPHLEHKCTRQFCFLVKHLQFDQKKKYIKIYKGTDTLSCCCVPIQQRPPMLCRVQHEWPALAQQCPQIIFVQPCSIIVDNY